ncbi:DUF1120 domain-containing protein [Herbaspirillum sp. YR522]|uniref:DUF1120 domain-containing protein n=1 Tax=Herbaspirillum sp. YR522 TaxID=1144342 RepID=UPI00026F919A|nr:DUF1120 domain-containing protein [Herbaspirillum sp. YR522]EJM96048.1 Protein of unknown function (DUF1120) [Herbaspirillum sp. YR522]
MKKPLPTLMMVCLAALCSPCLAQQSELRIAGVIKPTACVPQLAGDSTFDLGNLQAAGVDGQGQPIERDLAIVITCDAPTRVGIRPQDNRADSVAQQLAHPRQRRVADASLGDDLFGLGTSGRRKLGGYEVIFVPGSFVADGQQVDTIGSRAGPQGAGANWFKRGAGRLRSGVVNTWAPTGTLQPGAYSSISGTLRVRAMLAPSSALQLTDRMQLDGSITLEMHYL